MSRQAAMAPPESVLGVTCLILNEFTHTRIHLYPGVCKHVCSHVFMRVCVTLCTHVCELVYACVCLRVRVWVCEATEFLYTALLFVCVCVHRPYPRVSLFEVAAAGFEWLFTTFPQSSRSPNPGSCVGGV